MGIQRGAAWASSLCKFWTMGVRPWVPDRRHIVSTVLQVAWYFLFFYMPGIDRKALVAALVEWHPVWGMTCAFLAMMYVGSILCFTGMGLVYWLNSPLLEQYRIRPQPWPWHEAAPGSPPSEADQGELPVADATDLDPSESPASRYVTLVRKVVKKYVADVCVGVPMCAGILYTFLSNLPAEDFVRVVEDTPPWYISTMQIMVGLAMFDTWFYFGHRLLHTPAYYARGHKRHHEFVTTMSMTGVWGTAEDGLLTMLIPGLAPILILKMHFLTSCQFTLIHYLQSVDDHCGYAFTFSPMRLIPGGGYPAEHNFHHSHCGGVPSKGNFALYFPFWDWALGTNKEWEKYVAANGLEGGVKLLPKHEVVEQESRKSR